MQINKTNNVIFLKDVESNIIKEAFIILKENVKVGNDLNLFENKIGINKLDVLKEAEELINQVIDKNNLNFERYKILKLQKMLKIQKVINIICVIILILCIIIK